jgi:ferrous iron transport protein A
MRPGQRRRIIIIYGGHGMVRRLNALGIYKGRIITKISAQWMCGPVVIRIDTTDIAIGYGIANRIMVSSDEVST